MSLPRLEVICGPMFAGKTSELVRRLRAGAVSGRVVAAFKPASDTRYSGSELVTHDGQRHSAWAVGAASELPEHVTRLGAQVVAIDEAHFFGTALVPIVRSMLEGGRTIIVAGIERDHRGRPFDPFPVLLCEADEVVKLNARCAICGGPAVHSQRMFASEEAVVVGGAESYQARCRACFTPGSGAQRGRAHRGR